MIGDVNLFLSLAETDGSHYEPDYHAEDAGAEVNINPPDSKPDMTRSTPTAIVTGELELVIADPSFQRRGYGRAALLTFLRYVLTHQSSILAEFLRARQLAPSPCTMTVPDTITTTNNNTPLPLTPKPSSSSSLLLLLAKISTSNVSSLSLFSTLGFTMVREEPNYFGEYELRLPPRLGLSEVQDMMRRYGLDRWEELVYR